MLQTKRWSEVWEAVPIHVTHTLWSVHTSTHSEVMVGAGADETRYKRTKQGEEPQAAG